MAVYCSKCGKKLGILSAKYKAEDGSVMCVYCLKEYKTKQEELKRKEPEQRQEEAEETTRNESYEEVRVSALSETASGLAKTDKPYMPIFEEALEIARSMSDE